MMIRGSGIKIRGRVAYSRGFTLVEMMVATALFVTVMLVSVSTLLALVHANRKAQSLQSIIDNLNVSLDGMERAIRTGSNFHCGGGDYRATQDCPSATDDPANHYVFAFFPYGKTPGSPVDQPWIYRYDPVAKRLERSGDGGANFLAITAPEVTIDSLQFYVVGSTRGCSDNPSCDTVQPKVVAVIKGTAPVTGGPSRTAFRIQMTAVQRILDI